MAFSTQAIAKHLYIEGLVQGVSYRYYLRDQALQLGVSGWCRNLPDGRVETLLFGQADAVAALIDWTHEGPPEARVSRVTLEDVVYDEKMAESLDGGFEIRR